MFVVFKNTAFDFNIAEIKGKEIVFTAGKILLTATFGSEKKAKEAYENIAAGKGVFLDTEIKH